MKQETNLNYYVYLYGPRGGLIDWGAYPNIESAYAGMFQLAKDNPNAESWELSKDLLK